MTKIIWITYIVIALCFATLTSAQENPFLAASKTVNLIFPDYLGLCTTSGTVSSSLPRNLTSVSVAPKNILQRATVLNCTN